MESSHVRLKFAVGALVVSFAAFGCGGSSPTGNGGGGGGGGGGAVETTSVTVVDSNFNPGAIRVAPGATVTWTFTGSEMHNVTFASASITDIPDRNSGSAQATMPTATGTYSYQCTNHAGMTGTVQVQ